MEMHFYRGEGPENDRLIQEINELLAQCQKAREKFASDFGADTIWTRGRRVCGIVFRKRQEKPWLKVVYSGGDFFAYSAVQGTAKGRAMIQRIREEAVLHFDPSRHILESLRLQRTIIEPGGSHESGACIANGKIYVSIPGSKDRTVGTDPFPTIPTWFREIGVNGWTVAQGR